MKYAWTTFTILLILVLAAVFTVGCTDEATDMDENNLSPEYKTITDMRGMEVTIPKDPQRVVAMSRSLIDTTMYRFGIEDRIVGGSICNSPLKKGTYVWKGTDYTVNTWIGKILYPGLEKQINVGGFGGPYGQPNVETIAELDPDLFILRDLGEQEENTKKFIEQLNGMGIPVVVLRYPSCYENPDVKTIYEEVMVLGRVFGKENDAERIVDTMESRVDFISKRTGEVTENLKKDVLYFGAPTWAQDKGGVGYAFGSRTIEVSLMEEILNVNNVYPENGRNLISSEQLLALDPEIILLSTWSGYHPPRQLYDEEIYGNIQEMKAITEEEIYSLAATPCKSERLEFPVNLMISAKAVYPEKFEDIDLETWIREYIIELYGTDKEMTDEIMDAFMLEYLEIV